MASLMNGLSSLGSGVAQFAGQAGLDAQKGILAQQQAILADQLATTRETTLEGQRQTFQTGLEGQRQTFQSGENTKSQTADMARVQATIAGSAANTRATIAGEAARQQMIIDAPSPEIKSARQFAGLNDSEKKAYREEMMTKAGLPPWMMGDDMAGGAAPAAPDASAVTGDTSAPMPGDAPATATPSRPGLNEKALTRLPATAQSLVKGMVDGRISPPSSFAASKPYWQNLIQMATTYDPTFDETTWSGRVATRKSVASGPIASGVTAINTALSHAGTMLDDFDKLNNTSIPPLNWAVNKVEQTFGDPRQGKAEQTVNALASEARKVFAASGGGNLTELQEWQKSFPLNGSPSQQKASLTGFVELLDGRLQALADQINRGMGRADDPINLLQPKGRAVYEKLTGHEPTHATAYQDGKAPDAEPQAAAKTPAAAAPKLPSIGDVQQGYTYSGGDPSDPASWKAAQ